MFLYLFKNVHVFLLLLFIYHFFNHNFIIKEKGKDNMLDKSIELCLSRDIPFVNVFTGHYTEIRIHYIVMFTLTVMILLSKQNIKVDTFEELINNKNEVELGDL